MTITYLSIDDPATLQPIPFTLQDVLMLGRGEEANIGTDMQAPRQLNCRYASEDDIDMTYVHPTGAHNTMLPWKFVGFVSPQDCRSWLVASLAPVGEVVDEEDPSV